MSETIRINFGRPIAIFALPHTVVLPHETLPLHVFEPRYTQLVRDCLDREGQFAVATRERPRSTDTANERAIRPAVCVTQIIRHEKLPQDRYHVWVHGVCRATINEMIAPDEVSPYPTAHLEPVESLDAAPPPMANVRSRLRDLLHAPNMDRLTAHEQLLEWIEHDEIPTRALIELISLATVTDTERKYTLLAEGDPYRRATLIAGELRHLGTLLDASERQGFREWPKGMSWN